MKIGLVKDGFHLFTCHRTGLSVPRGEQDENRMVRPSPRSPTTTPHMFKSILTLAADVILAILSAAILAGFSFKNPGEYYERALYAKYVSRVANSLKYLTDMNIF